MRPRRRAHLLLCLATLIAAQGASCMPRKPDPGAADIHSRYGHVYRTAHSRDGKPTDISFAYASDRFSDEELADIGRWPTLEAVDLSNFYIKGPGLRHLKELPLLEKLELKGT